MRLDLNKQLTERQRIGHEAKFHDVRGAANNRFFDEDAQGGKVSIHRHRRNSSKVDRKRFSENLNPLRHFLRVNVGRPWNTIFSELNAAFDRRKVVNDHVFVHLFEFVEVNAKFVNGKVCVLNSYIDGRIYDETGKPLPLVNGAYAKRWEPIEDRRTEWYVHPVDGLLKANKHSRLSKKARKVQQENARKKELESVFRVVDADRHLYFENGVWMVYEMKDRPPPVRRLCRPFTMSSVEWIRADEATQKERGRFALVAAVVHEIKPEFASLRFPILPKGRYYASRQTAGRKLLKQFGLKGAAVFKDEGRDSSRPEMRFAA